MTGLAWWVASMGIVLALIVIIGILALWRVIKEKKSGFPAADERTQKINGRAAYYAMYMYQYFIIAYLAVNIVAGEFFGMPEIEAGYPMIAALLVSCLSFIALRWHFGRKGEL